MGLSTRVPLRVSRGAIQGAVAAIPILLGGLPAASQSAEMPVLRSGQQCLAIEALDIQVQVVGTLATTTWDLTFRNPQNRVLEGELVFPLGEGQTVSRFALPVNGVLREGVVVPKSKGQEAFETVVRRPTRVDPGLLEKTEGNAFHTRIYPIPALGTYRVVIAYEQELGYRGKGGLVYRLPLAFKDRVGRFTVRLAVEEQEANPRATTAFPGLAFRQAGRSWKAEYQGRNLRVDQPLELVIPRAEGRRATFIHREGELHRFYTQIDLPAHREPKPHAGRILVVWDASASAQQRDLKRERALLASYLKALGEVRVDVAVLRNDVEAPVSFQVKDGECKALLRFLEAAPLDGGTRMEALALAQHPAGEVLMFSDGMSNLGSGTPALPAVPLTVISSSVNARHAWMRSLAEGQGGEYLNLQELKDSAALHSLSTWPLAFLGFSGAIGDVHEVLPARGEVIHGSFGLSGLQISDRTKLTLKFGYGQRVAFTREVTLDVGSSTEHPLATRIWAQKKLAALAVDPDRNREEILRLGQAHGIVTEETSLIVLETLEDYARFKITPPAELRAAYDQMVARTEQQKAGDRESKLANLAARLEEEKRWWAAEYKPTPAAPPLPPSPPTQPAPAPQPPSPTPVPAPAPPPAPASAPAPAAPSGVTPLGTGTLEGEVLDGRGAPMAGAQVQVVSQGSGGARFVVSDGSGRFRLPLLPLGPVRLTVSREGFQSNRIDLTVQHGTIARLRVRMMAVASAVVEVVAATPSVDATSTATARNFSTESFQNVPRGRSQESVQRLAPGIAGAQASGNLYLVDGQAVGEGAKKSGRVEIAAWSPDAPYLRALREAQPHERYAAYLNLRKAYGAAPGFYMDVCDFFAEQKDRATAIRVLSNLAELDLDHPGLLRVLAHRLQQLGEHGLAIQAFERVLKLRAEEPQSLRDLGLAQGRAGHHQQAADTLYQMLVGHWDGRFANVDLIALNELNALIATRTVATRGYDRRILANLPVDIRVVLTWDTNDSDMDLWITDPKGEKCLYSHNRTAIGGRLSRDITGGYGPEEFMLRRAIPGIYKIEANYFGTRQQTAVVGPTTLKAELFLHYGTPQEIRKEILLKLDGRGQTVAVGTFELDAK